MIVSIGSLTSSKLRKLIGYKMSVSQIKLVLPKTFTLAVFIFGLLTGPALAATEIKCKIKGVGERNYKLEGFFTKIVYERRNKGEWEEWCPTNEKQTFRMGNKEAFCQVAKFRHRNMLIWGDTVINFKNPGWKMRYRYAKIGQDYVDSQPNGREVGTCRFWQGK